MFTCSICKNSYSNINDYVRCVNECAKRKENSEKTLRSQISDLTDEINKKEADIKSSINSINVLIKEFNNKIDELREMGMAGNKRKSYKLDYINVAEAKISSAKNSYQPKDNKDDKVKDAINEPFCDLLFDIFGFTEQEKEQLKKDIEKDLKKEGKI